MNSFSSTLARTAAIVYGVCCAALPVAAQIDINNGPGGPILVIASSSNPFTKYYAEILRAEGMNLFSVLDITQVSPSTLTAFDVAILGEMPLSPAQVSMLAGWVNSGGGNLIAMRPDPQLSGLLGLTGTGSTLKDTYLAVNPATKAGTGIVGRPIGYHGTADLYTTNGATAIATLYSNAVTATTNPAVTLQTAGSGGGKAAAFTYDLAKSVVYTRQGNPAWAGQYRTGDLTVRSADLFYGNATAYLAAADWNSVKAGQVEIPAADEQQRLLVNLILQMTADRKPLPRLWYLPSGKKAVVIMTGDDHATGGTAGRFDIYKSYSKAGCSVANWECIRSTSYIYPGKLTPQQALSYTADGFEIGVHLNTNCRDFTPATLDSFYTTQLGNFASLFSGVPAPSTNRTHCIAWSDYDTQPQVELQHGIRLDTTYYYYPSAWSFNPGFFTGSGLPQRFATQNGALIDVYQAATQIPDESLQIEPDTINSLLNKALGPEGYYAAITANMHTDGVVSVPSDQIISSARSRGVSVISSRQMLTWLDARNSSSFSSVGWSGNLLAFIVNASPAANGLQALLPAGSPAGLLTGITKDGLAVAYAVQVIKGVQYATFPALSGSYVAVYGTGTPPPPPIAIAITPGAMNLSALQTQQLVANVTGTTNTNVLWSISPDIGGISSTGMYTAPATISIAQTITVKAASLADPTKSATATISLTPAPTPTPAATIGANPVGYWSFDTADVRGALALDKSPNGMHGVLQNTGFSPGKAGQALVFSGNNSSVIMTNDNAANLYSSMSFVFWMKTSNTTRIEAVLSKYDASGRESGYLIKTTPAGNLALLVGGYNVVSGPRQIFDRSKINDGQWHHVAVVIAFGQDVKFYIDGALSSSQLVATQFGTTYTQFQLGAVPYTFYGDPFTGSLDEVRIFRQALNLADISQLLAAGTGN